MKKILLALCLSLLAPLAASASEAPLLSATAQPNPVSKTVTVRVAGAPEKISITVFNIVGTLVGSYETDSPVAIDLSAQPSGMYLVHVQSGSSITTLHITVDH